MTSRPEKELAKQALKKIFATRLREALDASGKTQRTLGSAVGKSPATVSRWLSEEKIPSAESIRRIAITLEVSTDWLMGMPRGAAAPRKKAVVSSKALRRLVRHLEDISFAARKVADLLPTEE
jgi:transcriptional regulator with XRE-family HTH domain